MARAAAWRSAGGIAVREMPPAVVAATAAAGVSAPPVAERGAVMVVADARLVGRRTLAQAIGSEHLPEASAPTDAELVLGAYRRWGGELADHLHGSFAFALWDAERQRLLCARDPIGSRSLHYARSGEAVLVASDARQVLASGAAGRELDGIFFLDLLTSNYREQARSPFAAVRRVLPGHCLSAGAGGFREWRYWNPDRTGLGHPPRGAEEWVEAFRDILRTVVREHLEDAEGGAALLTSGGLDSSTVAALAQAAFHRGEIRGRPLAVIDVFERLRECDESEYSRVLVEETGIAAERIVADDLTDLRPGRPEPDDPPDSPYAVSGELAGRVLGRAAATGCRVLTTGYGGDSLFDAARWQTYDHVRRGLLHRMVPWIAGSVAAGAPWYRAVAAHLVPPILTYGGRRRLDRLRGRASYWQPPPWLPPDLRATAAERLLRQGYPRRYRSFARQRQWEHVVGLAQQGAPIEFWTANAARYGLETAFPLLDRRLAELVLAAPVELGARPGPAGSKWLLRQATVGILPEQVRRRPDKASWSAHTRESLCASLRPELRRRFDGRSRLAALGLVDDAALAAGLDRYCEEGTAAQGGLLALAWMAERWLAECGIEASGPRFIDLETWERDEMV